MRWATLYEGRWVFGILLAGTFLIAWLSPWGIPLGVAAILFSLWFFRDPERQIPLDADALVSPADGRVTAVEFLENLPQGGKGWRISIFLSVFSVHVNRAPAEGKITAREYRPGKFLDARHPESAFQNESMTWTFVDSLGRALVVRQITGAIARRIVPWCEVGATVPRGYRFGMIRFGSRTDLFFEDSAQPCVEVGDAVAGAQTIVARWKSIP